MRSPLQPGQGPTHTDGHSAPARGTLPFPRHARLSCDSLLRCHTQFPPLPTPTALPYTDGISGTTQLVLIPKPIPSEFWELFFVYLLQIMLRRSHSSEHRSERQDGPGPCSLIWHSQKVILRAKYVRSRDRHPPQHLIIQFNSYLLSICYVPGTMLETGNIQRQTRKLLPFTNNENSHTVQKLQA